MKIPRRRYDLEPSSEPDEWQDGSSGRGLGGSHERCATACAGRPGSWQGATLGFGWQRAAWTINGSRCGVAKRELPDAAGWQDADMRR